MWKKFCPLQRWFERTGQALPVLTLCLMVSAESCHLLKTLQYAEFPIVIRSMSALAIWHSFYWITTRLGGICESASNR